MNSKQALVEAQRRWGKNAAVRDEPKHASTPERREAAREAMRAFRDLPEEERKARRKERDELLFASSRYRYTVGRIALGMYFAVEGQGDSWKAAFAQCDERNKKYAKAA